MLKYDNKIRVLEEEKKRLEDLYKHFSTEEEDIPKETFTEIRKQYSR